MLHICRNLIEHLAADVDRALGFTGTMQTCVSSIGEANFNPTGVDGHLAYARKFDAYPNVWLYPNPGSIGMQKVKVTDAKLRTDAKSSALSLRKHLDLGGKGGGMSILAECNDKWLTTPADYKQAFEDIAGIVKDQVGDAFQPGWGLSSMMALSNAASYRPPSATWFDLHAYATFSVNFSVMADGSLKANTQQAARLMALCEMAQGMGLPIGVGEAGLTDIADIAASGKAAWLDYWGRLIGGSPAGVDLAVRYGFTFVHLTSQDWSNFPNWHDGRWATGLTKDEAIAIYGPNPWPGVYGYPGAPEACAVMKKKLTASASIVKWAPPPFMSTGVGPVTAVD